MAIMLKIGIPKALLYYQYFPLWSTFFQELGMEVVTSDPTSKAIMAAGSGRMVAETCLPVKVYCGHILHLAGKSDYVFIPARQRTPYPWPDWSLVQYLR